MKRRISVLSGAGISADSGIATFRGSGGLWEDHDIMEVASPEGWKKDFRKVLNFYNIRRRAIAKAKPNQAHLLLSELEKLADVHVITQNIDHLHESAGNSKILHLHGEITKARSQFDENYTIDIGFRDIEIGENCPHGYQLRPHIVWFGEAVPAMEEAISIVSSSEILLVIGTSLEVYPAAGLLHYIPETARIVLIDPEEVLVPAVLRKRVRQIKMKAGEGMKVFLDEMRV